MTANKVTNLTAQIKPHYRYLIYFSPLVQTYPWLQIWGRGEAFPLETHWIILIWTTRPFDVALLPLLQLQHPHHLHPHLVTAVSSRKKYKLLYSHGEACPCPTISAVHSREEVRNLPTEPVPLCATTAPRLQLPWYSGESSSLCLYWSSSRLCTFCLPALSYSFFLAAAQGKHCDVREGWRSLDFWWLGGGSWHLM